MFWRNIDPILDCTVWAPKTTLGTSTCPSLVQHGWHPAYILAPKPGDDEEAEQAEVRFCVIWCVSDGDKMCWKDERHQKSKASGLAASVGPTG